MFWLFTDPEDVGADMPDQHGTVCIVYILQPFNKFLVLWTDKWSDCTSKIILFLLKYKESNENMQ